MDPKLNDILMKFMNENLSAVRQRVNTYQQNLIYVLEIELANLNQDCFDSNQMTAKELFTKELAKDIRSVIDLNQKNRL